MGHFVMTFGLMTALAIVFGMLFYVLFYVFFPQKEVMREERLKKRRYYKIGFWAVLTLISFGISFVTDRAYTVAFVVTPILCTSAFIAYNYRKQIK